MLSTLQGLCLFVNFTRMSGPDEFQMPSGGTESSFNALYDLVAMKSKDWINKAISTQIIPGNNSLSHLTDPRSCASNPP